MKRLLAAAALVTSIAAMSLPASAANTVTIKWNVAAVSSLVLQGNYSNTGAGSVAAITPLVVANGGTGACAGGGAANVGNGTTALTLDFGAITPDQTKVTGCVGLNAAEAQVNTNDTLGVQVQEAQTTASANGASICGVLIKSNAPSAWSAAGQTSANFAVAGATDTTDTTAANWAGTTCAGLTYSAASVNAALLAAAAATVVNTNNNTTNPFYMGEDYAVMIPANATKGADSAVVTYTLVTN